MKRRPSHIALAIASLAVVLTAAAVSTGDRWNFDFAQYQGPNRPEPQDEFRFVLVGDRNGGRVPGLMPQAFREINHLYPEFVVSVGDLIDGPTNTEPKILQFWKEFDDEVALLKSPFVYVPGNHDIWDASSKDIYEARYGPTYRSFNYRGLHFISLDTEEMDDQGRKTDRIDGKQLEWLKQDLERNRDARRILVLLHKPIWLSGGLAKAEELWKGMRVHVFAGHDHRYSYQEINGIPHIILGAVAGGMREEGDAVGRFRHYALATVQGNDLKLALIRLGGVMAPDVVLEEELPGIRQLADACGIYPPDGGDAAGEARVVFTNPLKSVVAVQVERTARVAGKPEAVPLFAPRPPELEAGAVMEKQVAAKSFAAPPGNVAAEYRATFKFTNARGEPQAIDFPVEPRRRRTLAVANLPANPIVDGDLAEWADAKWQSINDAAQVTLGPTQWKGSADLSAEFAVARDSASLWIAVRVKDDNVAFNTTAVEGDSIELFTASPSRGEISFSRDADWHRLLIAPFAADGKSVGEPSGASRVDQFGSVKLKGVRSAYARQSTGYTIELSVPLAELGWPAGAGTAQIDLAVNDRDLAARRDSQLTWSGTDRDAFSSRYYGRVQLIAP
jgi:hypothetical protein